MDYQFKQIEKDWQKFWAANETFKAEVDESKPKYYVLDMFPYPSGAGLHVGHPLGYIASDIFARYKRLKGFNVLHPMGYDSFGLPAEQYAIQTGQHPAKTTEANVNRYREQLDNLGFSFDWSKEVRTSSPEYYKWTQWIFMQLFNSWYNKETDKAEPISTLITKLETIPSSEINAVCDEDVLLILPVDWSTMSAEEKQAELLKYRLTYLKESTVNWCAALGTVLANDEVKDGFSERGGYPVEQKKMMQWSMRISAYAERLLQGLNTIDWPEPLKEMQRNWIGKSVGAMMKFSLIPNPSPKEKGAQENRVEFVADERGGKVELKRGYETANSFAWDFLKENAKKNRKNQTNAEVVLWNSLRNSQTGFKIRRQHVIEGYITDFVCLPKRLVIEVDGGYHNDKEAIEYDKQRTDFLNKAGFEVIRFTNEQAIENTQEVITTIKEKLQNITTMQVAPSPLEKVGDEASTIKAAPSPLKRVGGEAFIEVFTTRVDTAFGVSFLVIAPEHELVASLTTPEQKTDIDNYILATKKKSELDRMSDVKTVSGAFTGSYAINPLNGAKVQIWIADYVLAGYGTGAVMAVPSGDQRDYLFAKHFNLPIIQILDAQKIDKEADSTKVGKYINSGIINGLGYKEATTKIISKLKELGMGYGKINYRMRDAIFGRQRYWGEPVPVYFKNGLPYLIAEEELPLLLPEVDKYLPTESGEPPLGRAKDWKYKGASPQPSPKEREQLGSEGLSFGEDLGEAYEYELSTMPGWAGSSWYWYRYMDAKNDTAFADKDKIAYWKDVDLYIGGSEHATGHLLYSRFWNKFLKDIGYVTEEEPFKKLINQGMIQGRSSFIHKLIFTSHEDFQSGSMSNLNSNFPLFISHNLSKRVLDGTLSDLDLENLIHEQLGEEVSKKIIVTSHVLVSNSHVDVKYVENDVLNIDLLKTENWMNLVNAEFILENGKYICGTEVEKMSKSKYNVVSPDDLVERYGADTLRMYEMFLGPLEQSKPWNTNGIEGVFKFLRKFWKLFHDDSWNFTVTDVEPTKAELKSLHKIIKKVEDDVERFSFNTSVSSFMIAVNELTDLKSNNKSILQDLVVILSPYAPHICEELWKLLGNEAGTLCYTPFPKFNAEYLVENEFAYPVSVNGKTKTNLLLSLALEPAEVEKEVMANDQILKYLDGKTPKKVIVVKGRIINIVI